MMDLPALKENYFKDIPVLDPVVIRKVRETYGIQSVEDFSPEGDRRSKPIPWKKISASVMMRDGYSCRVCGKSDLELVNSSTKYNKLHLGLEVHHIIPRKDGGSDSFSNLITLCEECHRKTFSNGYSGIPADPEDVSLYRYEKDINLALMPEMAEQGMRIRNGTLKNYQRSESGFIVPYEGSGIQVFYTPLSLSDYRNIILQNHDSHLIHDYVTMNIRSNGEKTRVRVLKDTEGHYLI